ncbi:MAG: hypothetical protein HY290_11950 [Planctomycetia bacterium]|nr:hypothetical protein [Planctomycetia bacterium]
MNQREKLLAGGLLAVVGIWQGSVQYQHFVVAPVAERQTDIDARSERISKKEIENWLFDLATKAKLSDIAVTAKPTGAVAKGDTYTVVSADLTAQGTLPKIRDFLYDFRNSGLLHRVAKLTLTSPQPTGDPTIQLKMTVEGLSLKEAPARSTLLSEPNLAELAKDPAAKSKEAYETITKKNLFVRGYNGPPGAKPGTRPPSTEEDPRQFVRLTSTFSNGGEYQATLYDPTTNKTARLYAGSEFNLAGVEGKVVSVNIDYVVLEVKEVKYRLDLGRNLTELEKLPAAKAPPSDAGG